MIILIGVHVQRSNRRKHSFATHLAPAIRTLDELKLLVHFIIASSADVDKIVFVLVLKRVARYILDVLLRTQLAGKHRNVLATGLVVDVVCVAHVVR